MSDREFLHMTPSFRSIEPSQTVHYWPWSRTSTSCLAVHCRSCTSSSAVELKYTLTVYQRPSRLRDYLACTHANTSTVKYGGPASHPRKSQAARNKGAILAPGCPQSSFESCKYAFTGRDILCLLSHSSGQQMEL